MWGPRLERIPEDMDMSEESGVRPYPAGRMLIGAVALATAWAAWGLVRHPAFQPASVLRIAAPILALVIGGAFTRLVAQVRAQVDAEREFDRGGKALFMGFVMVGITFVAWLLVSQAVPATLNALVGSAGTEPGVVVRRVPETGDADCRHRLVVASGAGGTGLVPVERARDECVEETVWRAAAESGPVTLLTLRSALGAELVGVAAAR